MQEVRSRATTYRHLVFLLLCMWIGIVLFVALRHISGLLTEHHYTGTPLWVIHFVTLYCWLPWFAIAPFVALIARRFPIRPDRWLGPLAVNAWVLLGISIAHGLVVRYCYHYLGYMDSEMATYQPWQHAGHVLFGDNLLLLDTLTYAVLAASLNVGNFYRLARHHELDALQLRETLAEQQLQTLRMQINPHFLFNSLNAVAVLVQKNEPVKAVEMINRIASFFRRTLEGTGEQWVPLARELEIAAEYLAIARVRYGERLNVTEECDQSMKSVPVPAMLLQPLLENAVTHGIAEKAGACGLALRCKPSHDRCEHQTNPHAHRERKRRLRRGAGGRHSPEGRTQLQGCPVRRARFADVTAGSSPIRRAPVPADRRLRTTRRKAQRPFRQCSSVRPSVAQERNDVRCVSVEDPSSARRLPVRLRRDRSHHGGARRQ
jgi:hypothetical protein